MFTKIYAKFGVQFSFVDATSLDNIEKAFTPQTKMLWLETPSNPLLRIIDLAGASAIGKKRGAIVVVDNTFASPYLQQPLKLGADLVVHSTTKYLGGHSDVVGGAVIGRDDELRARVAFVQNSLGGSQPAFDSFLVLRGTKTLAVRMDRHQANALAVARWLESRREIAQVLYPGLRSHPQHALARRQMSGYGGMVTFAFREGPPVLAHARDFLAALRVFTCAESLGGVESLAEHPAIMTHASIPPERRQALGIDDGLVRLSVGIEHADDLIADIERALRLAHG
jgi:cystathionine gamma-lyase